MPLEEALLGSARNAGCQVVQSKYGTEFFFMQQTRSTFSTVVLTFDDFLKQLIAKTIGKISVGVVRVDDLIKLDLQNNGLSGKYKFMIPTHLNV